MPEFGGFDIRPYVAAASVEPPSDRPVFRPSYLDGSVAIRHVWRICDGSSRIVASSRMDQNIRRGWLANISADRHRITEQTYGTDDRADRPSTDRCGSGIVVVGSGPDQTDSICYHTQFVIAVILIQSNQ